MKQIDIDVKQRKKGSKETAKSLLATAKKPVYNGNEGQGKFTTVKMDRYIS